jgi:cytochrome c2
VSKQLHYIIAAFLLLLVFSGLFFFVKMIHVHDPGNIEAFSSHTPGRNLEISPLAAQGKILFQSKCNSCHLLFKDATGPDLTRITDNDQWSDRKKLYAWIRNPAAFMKNDVYTQQMKERFGSVMTAFPDLTDKEIDAIVEYIAGTRKPVYNGLPVASR